jgi:predicted nuclease with TOPRIM domain
MSLALEEPMKLLESELTAVLEELKPLLAEEADTHEKAPPLNIEQIQVLFDKLEPMLENINPECVNLLDEIRIVPGTEELVNQIENYDFESAAIVLAGLKEKW